MKSQSDLQNNVPIVVVAAGRGSRAGAGLPKQYRKICGHTLLRHTIDSLLASPQLGPIVPVIHPDDLSFFKESCSGLEIGGTDIAAPVMGGATRQDSALNGLRAARSLAPNSQYVMIHDAARPFASEDLLEDLIKNLKSGAVAVIPAVAVVDTLKFVEDSTIQQTVDRTGLYRVQTPQAFDFEALLAAYKNTDPADHTDDASIMEASGHKLLISKGCDNNFKVTTPADFTKAELLMKNDYTDVRTGMGYDVHRFESGDAVTLCGVHIPHSASLKGHSDADVAMHALTDALFSAVSAGDIGSHFPPSDPQWKGAASHIFLKKACAVIQENQGIINHMAVTIICEQPKIGPHRAAMQQKLSDITGVAVDRISVQATTTEKLGFTGREEGIAAQAIATVRLKSS